MYTASSGMTTVKPRQSNVVNTRYGDRQVIELPAMEVFGEISGPNPDPKLTKAPREAENPLLLSEFQNSGYKRINPNRPVSEPFNNRKYFQTGSTRPQQIQGYVSSDKKVHYYYDADGNPKYGSHNEDKGEKGVRSSSNLVPNLMRDPKDFVLEGTLQYGNVATINMQSSSLGPTEIPDFLAAELKAAYGKYSTTHVRVECRSGEFYIFARPEGGEQPQHPYVVYLPQTSTVPQVAAGGHRFRELDGFSRPVYYTQAPPAPNMPYQPAPIYRQGYSGMPIMPGASLTR